MIDETTERLESLEEYVSIPGYPFRSPSASMVATLSALTCVGMPVLVWDSTYAHELLDLALLHALLQGALLGCGKPVFCWVSPSIVPILDPPIRIALIRLVALGVIGEESES